MLPAVSTKTDSTLWTWCPFSSFLPADSPSHVVSNQRNRTSRLLKNNSSVFPTAGNIPVKKLSVRQDNPLASKTGETFSFSSSFLEIKCATNDTLLEKMNFPFLTAGSLQLCFFTPATAWQMH